MKLAKIFAAAALAVAGVSAHADAFNNGGQFVNLTLGASYDWTFGGSMTELQNRLASSAFETDGSLIITSIDLLGYGTDSWTITPIGAATIATMDDSIDVGAGAYTVRIKGDGFGTVYAAATVTAVPEPESYAMMLAGLGALGFMARRRKAK